MSAIGKVYQRWLLLIALATTMALGLAGSDLTARRAEDAGESSQPDRLYVWTTLEGEAAYRAAYDAMLEL